MSAIQGPPPNSQPAQSPAENSNNTPAQKQEAEKNGNDFDKAMNQKKKGGTTKGKDNSAIQDGKARAGDKEEGLEDLFRQTHRKKDGEEELPDKNNQELHKESNGVALTDAAKSMEAQLGKTTEVQAVDNKAIIDRIEKIADKIMISNAADVKTIKVDFKDGILPGTEVLIRKDAAGKLQIEFTTTSTESFNFLNKGEQTLVDTLNRKIGGDITVDIKMQGGDSGQDTGDGRSREQYLPDDQDNKDD